MSTAVFDILKKYDETDRANVWQVQNATVIKHACLERVAAKAGIVFDKPTILRAERDEAVIMVAGTLDKRSEWSIGEALIGANYRVSGKQTAYVYAMAEKRAKDRVILKLVGLHGLAYSEDEADEFKEPQTPEPSQHKRELYRGELSKPLSGDPLAFGFDDTQSVEAYKGMVLAGVKMAKSSEGLARLWKDQAANRKRFNLENDRGIGLELVTAFQDRKAELLDAERDVA